MNDGRDQGSGGAVWESSGEHRQPESLDIPEVRVESEHSGPVLHCGRCYPHIVGRDWPAGAAQIPVDLRVELRRRFITADDLNAGRIEKELELLSVLDFSAAAAV